MLLNKNFYDRNTLLVAQDLLGCFLIRKSGSKIIKSKIVETEAYCGFSDKASHASRGLTKRNEVMFGEAGIIYVYFTYGMHSMLNIVTEKKNYPAAVLIRALEPIGEKLITNGPARLTKTLKIDKNFNGLPIYVKKYGLWVEGRNEKLIKSRIIKSKRIGIDYAEEYKNKNWRFYIKDNEYITRR